MCWNACPSLPAELDVARFRRACPVAFEAPDGRPVLACLGQQSQALPALHPGYSSGRETVRCLGTICFAHPCRENGSAFCNCYHLFPSIVFVDVFLF